MELTSSSEELAQLNILLFFLTAGTNHHDVLEQIGHEVTPLEPGTQNPLMGVDLGFQGSLGGLLSLEDLFGALDFEVF